MKLLPILTLLLLSLITSTHSVHADSICLDLKTNRETEMKRLESAKVKLFEQDLNASKVIREKQLKKIVSIEEKTAARVQGLQSILVDLEAIESPSKGVATTIINLSVSLEKYNTDTKKSLEEFSTGLEKILADKTESTTTTVNQYQTGLIKLYDESILECNKVGLFNKVSFTSNVEQLQKRVIDAEKNTKKLLKGVDALYANLVLELDKSDSDLNFVLKSTHATLLSDPSFN